MPVPFPYRINKLLWVLLLALCIAPSVQAEQKGRIARAFFTTQISDREPVDQVLILDNSVSSLYFFTDIRHMEGSTVIHRWEHDGKVVLKKEFKINGPRWRVYSQKDLAPGMKGKWMVVVTDETGWPLKAVMFRYVDRQDSETEPVILPLSENQQ